MKPGTCKIAPYSSSRSGAHPEPPTSGSRGRLPAGRCPLFPARRRTAPRSAERRVPHAPAAGRRSRHAAPQQPIGRFLSSAGGGRPARPGPALPARRQPDRRRMWPRGDVRARCFPRPRPRRGPGHSEER